MIRAIHAGDGHRGPVHVVDATSNGRAAVAAVLHAHGVVVHEHAGLHDLLADRSVPDAGCVLIDAGPDGMPALAIQAALRSRGVDAPVIVLARSPRLRTCIACMRAGAADFLDRSDPPDALWTAVTEALDAAARRGGMRAEMRARLARLTQREREVVSLVVAGGRNAQIAARLGIATQTVKTHRSRAMTKLSCETPADLARLWWTAAGSETPASLPLAPRWAGAPGARVAWRSAC